MKAGVTSDLALDVTLNPDFGQVEADPADVFTQHPDNVFMLKVSDWINP